MKAYVYPNIEQSLLGSKNPYISNLKTSLFDNGFKIDLKYSENAFLDLLKNGYSSNCIVLNWVEDMPSKRFGFSQVIVFYFFILLCRFNSKKIVWVKHNKISHNKNNWKLKKAMHGFLTTKASLILTHAKDAGLGKLDKLFFIHHPNTIDTNNILTPSYSIDTPIDFLIWGTIIPYKGILEFLQFVGNNDRFKGIKIRVVGKCNDLNYLNELNKYQSDDIQIENKYISNDGLNYLYCHSRFILFPYKSASVMSSGTLIESLVACKRIVGPQCGAFNDLEEEGFVTTYKSFDDIMSIYNKYYNNYILSKKEIMTFLDGSSWVTFGSKLKKALKSIHR